jgi:MFS family permease
MVGAALGGVLGAGAWVLAQRLPEDLLMSWGWRAVFWSSLLVTIAAAIIRAKMAESPVFEELKATVDVENQAPLKVVAKHGRTSVLRVVLMNWGVSTQSYMYQVFLVGYLAAVVGVGTTFIPPVQLAASVAAAAAAFATGWLSDRFGRRRMTLVLCGILVVTPFIVFPGLNSGSKVVIIAIIVLGYMFAAQGVTGVHMSYLPELFGSRYRYSGVTLGREISSVIGGGVAPLLGSALLTLFLDSWVPVAIYMALTMLVSFAATLTAPETVNRDLNIPTDAVKGEERPGIRA